MNNIIKNKFIYVLIFLMMSLIFINAAPDAELAYSGFITQKNGDAVNGNISMTFTLYNASIDGSMEWSEIQRDVTVDEGEFSVMLGTGETVHGILEPAIFDQQLWLGISLDSVAPAEYQYYDYANEYETVYNTETRGEMQPRIKLSMSPYAFYAERVKWGNVDGIPLDIADGDQVGITNDEEKDQVFVKSEASKMQPGDVDKWNTASDKVTTVESWGDHSQAGYLKSETDPEFKKSAAADITSSQIDNWDITTWGEISDKPGYITGLGEHKIEVHTGGRRINNNSVFEMHAYDTNKTVTKEFVIFNTGISNLVISEITDDSEFYTISSSAVTIAPGDYHEIVVSYQPNAIAKHKGTIMIRSNDVYYPHFIIYIDGACLKRYEGTKVYSTVGTHIFSLPGFENVSLDVTVIGAGGGGGGNVVQNSNLIRKGAGGNAGERLTAKTTGVDDDYFLFVKIGAGGKAGKSGGIPGGTNGSKGDDTAVVGNIPLTVIAKGGTGGLTGSINSNYDGIGKTNGTGYGSGGNNQAPGQPGAVIIKWTGYALP